MAYTISILIRSYEKVVTTMISMFFLIKKGVVLKARSSNVFERQLLRLLRRFYATSVTAILKRTETGRITRCTNFVPTSYPLRRRSLKP
jgi:hypothetical protein